MSRRSLLISMVSARLLRARPKYSSVVRNSSSGAVDPLQVTRFEGAEQRSEPEGQRQPPQQRTKPHAEHHHRCATEGGISTAEAERGKDAEEGQDRDRVGQGQRECRQKVPQQALGIR